MEVDQEVQKRSIPGRRDNICEAPELDQSLASLRRADRCCESSDQKQGRAEGEAAKAMAGGNYYDN